MRQIFIYLAVVTLLATALAESEVNVSPGYVYELNLLVQYPLGAGVSWAGVYGDIDVVSKELASYYDGPFGYVVLSPADLNELTSSIIVNLRNQLHVTDLNNWYIVLSTRDDLNFADLSSSCDANLDALIAGTFCSECLPSETYTEDENLSILDYNYCAASTLVYENVPVHVLFTKDGNAVYFGDVGSYTILGENHNFGVLLSLPTTTNFYIYLVRKHVFCGDGVCDPGETGCSDCTSITVSVSPTSREANVGQTVSFSGTLRNDGVTNVTIQSLSVSVISGDANNVSSSISLSGWSLPRFTTPGTELNFTVNVSASAAGDYTLRVVVRDSGGKEYHSNDFVLHVVSPPPPEENETVPPPGGGAIEENVPEEENAPIKLETGGFYIPWAKCISNIKVSGPDRVNAKLEENVTVNLFVQNGGTCDEDIEMNFIISPAEEGCVVPLSFSLRAGEGKRVVFSVVPKRAGLHRVTIIAKGLVENTHSFDLFVSPEKAAYGPGECERDILILSPEEITIVEGEEINNIVVRNFGTCRERVTIILVKKISGTELTLDKKEIYLSGGENYYYVMPRLVAGDYELTITAGGQEKVSIIHVTPKPLFSGISDILARARLATFAFLVFLLIVLIGYIRYRYLS